MVVGLYTTLRLYDDGGIKLGSHLELHLCNLPAVGFDVSPVSSRNPPSGAQLEPVYDPRVSRLSGHLDHFPIKLESVLIETQGAQLHLVGCARNRVRVLLGEPDVKGVSSRAGKLETGESSSPIVTLTQSMAPSMDGRRGSTRSVSSRKSSKGSEPSYQRAVMMSASEDLNASGRCSVPIRVHPYRSPDSSPTYDRM